MKIVFDQSMGLQRQLISLEALNAQGVTAAGPLTEGVTNFMLTTKAAIAESTAHLTGTIKCAFSSDAKLSRTISTVPYMALSGVTVVVPQGLAIRQLDYLSLLEQSQGIVERMDTDVIIPARTWFAGLLGHPDRLRSISALHNGLAINMHTKDIQRIKAGFQAAFRPTVGTTQPFGKMFARNADWDIYQKRILALSHRLEALSFNKLTKDIKELSELTDKLYLRIKQDPIKYQLSNAVAAAISETLFLVAEELEFAAAYRQLGMIAVQCATDSAAKLKENLTEPA